MSDQAQRALGHALMDACLAAVVEGRTEVTLTVIDVHMVARVLMYGEGWVRA